MSTRRLVHSQFHQPSGAGEPVEDDERDDELEVCVPSSVATDVSTPVDDDVVSLVFEPSGCTHAPASAALAQLLYLRCPSQDVSS
ncbi:MAG: hypothetical protein ACRBN8_09000 [Nannocystales bacterium]